LQKLATQLQLGIPRTFLKPRIHIIGGSGSGKSHIAAQFAQHFCVPAYDLDNLFWDCAAGSYGVRTDSAKRDQQLIEIIAQNGWIIEGVYYQWLAPSFDAADIIIALTPSIWIRHWRVVRRFILRKLGKLPSKRESFAELWRLLRWSHAYDAVNLVQARKFIADRGRQIVECKTFADVLAATKHLDKLHRKLH
jgi:adenylate kinase family enzyme